MHSEYVEHVTGDQFGLQYLCYVYSYNKSTIQIYAGNTLHNLYGPALQSYYPNRNLKSTQYYVCGRLHRVVGPALINYCLGEGVVLAAFYTHDELQNEHGPSKVMFYKKAVYAMYFTAGVFQTGEQIYNSQTEKIREFRNMQNALNNLF